MPLPVLPPPPPGPVPAPVPALVRPYDPPVHPWAAGHRGLDLAASHGAGVRTLTAGTVAFVGRVAGIPVVTIGLPDGRRVTYQPVAAVVSPGDAVAAGQVIGRAAAGGHHCGGAPCIHVGLLDGDDYRDPTGLLRPAAAVLKPVAG